jgi:serine/threonine-protein kinase
MSSQNKCPDISVLEELASGRLDLTQLSALQWHLDSCPRCVRLLDQLQSPDPLVQAVNSIGQTTLVPPTRKVNAVIEKLKIHAELLEAEHWLSPAQNDDELGRLGGFIVRRVVRADVSQAIFACEEPTTKRKLSIVLFRSHLPSFDQLARLSRLHDPHLVAIHQVGEATSRKSNGTALFLVMEPLHGESLAEKVGLAQPISVEELLHIGKEVATGLAVLHGAKVLHGNINPNTIFMDGEQVKIDYPGTMTPGYLAPETFVGTALEPNADLFALGCVLYQLATRQPAYPSLVFPGMLWDIRSHTLAQMQQHNARLPDELCLLLLRMIAVEQNQRPTAAEVVEALTHLQQSPTSVRKTSGASVWWPVAVAGLGTMVVAGIGLWLLLRALMR